MPDKREQIENAATDAIKKSGVRNVSFRTLAETVGVKSASVHYHFPTKSDLAVSVVDKYTLGFSEALDAIDRKHKSVSSRLMAFARIFEDTLANGELCLCGMMASEVDELDQQTKASLQRFFREAERWLVKTLESQPDEVVSPLPPNELAKILMSGLEGAILIDRAADGRARIKALKSFIRSLF
ncbi:MAG: TetR/AcrR family transcriptional regulator [Pseudomonadota bacterium]